MNDDRPQQGSLTFYSYDSRGQMTNVREGLDPKRAQEVLDSLEDQPSPRFGFEHAREQGVFRLTSPGGRTEVFRDHPTRYLCVAPDAESGEMQPVMKRGKPVYLYLAREEPEVR